MNSPVTQDDPTAHGTALPGARRPEPPDDLRTALRGRFADGTAFAASARAVPYWLAAVCYTLYALYSLLRHQRMETNAYDLGLFEQVVRSYAHFEAPVSDIRGPGFNVLGEHFHPILALLAPVYRLFPGAATLLVAQALLIALSVVPMTRIGQRVFGNLGGAAFGAAYGLSWGLQSTIGFDFHEVCFAIPMLAFALERFVRAEYRAGLLWLLPTVLVKEDLALTLGAAGLFLLIRGRRRLAAAAIGGGAAVFALTVFVLLPAMNPHGNYPFWGNLNSGPPRERGVDPLAGADSVPVGELLLRLPELMLFPSQKWMTLLLLLLPTGFLALRSPLMLLALPTLLWRFTSTNALYWNVGYHYSAVLMPIVFAAFADAVLSLRKSPRDWLRRYAAQAAVIPIAVSVALAPHFPLMQLAHKRPWTVEPRVVTARAMLAGIPDGAQVSASDRFAPQLTDRTRVTLFPTVLPGPGWVAAALWGGGPDWMPPYLAALEAQGFRQVAARDGVLLLRRD
ncbi:DUF2079 domain-containing protein [Yinghuangia soli]|uniref:DUF2079 domain-containing protein n=1 Tax=Yinghuangia soli TaxID=2908204 RepID=A0AA41Q2A1_9ACTN|nr:DUF2079 domain-containing protein [Yinghuangia soli]MCF2530239.1 DUF2079 domain-containing protein [Yinghuangia soli]